MTVVQVRPRHSDRFKVRDLGEEYLFYDAQGDRVHVLNPTARSIYMLCDGTRTVEQIADELVATRAVDRETALNDVHRTVDQLLGLGLLAAG